MFDVTVPYRSHADTSNCAPKAEPEKSRRKRIFLSEKTKKIAVVLSFAHSVTTNGKQHDKLARTAPEHSLDRRYRQLLDDHTVKTEVKLVNHS